MTFDEYMRLLLVEYNEVAAKIRQLVTDPTVFNPEYAKLVDARSELDGITKRIFHLKEVTENAKRAHKRANQE